MNSNNNSERSEAVQNSQREADQVSITPIPKLSFEMPSESKAENNSVVRLTTSWWNTERELNVSKTLRYARRLSNSPFNILEEDVNAIGAKDAINSIVNLYDCPDGLYYVVTCDEHVDWESGCVDSYNLKLIPYTDEVKNG